MHFSNTLQSLNVTRICEAVITHPMAHRIRPLKCAGVSEREREREGERYEERKGEKGWRTLFRYLVDYIMWGLKIWPEAPGCKRI